MVRKLLEICSFQQREEAGMKITIKRRLPKAPRPEKHSRPIGTRKGAKGYNRSLDRRVERAAKGGDPYER